ncbi:MAG: DNA cytosine methyltransferase [Desulfurococcales archaeon]|jgi:DNA (cytosine-5)-methyltransferase 1|nr:DNA cytosine methyltransferase [Desulfurococcales archaeon]
MRRGYIAGVVDLFSGAGGFSRGFSDAGFEILMGIDSERSAIRSYKANFPEAIALQEDIQEISGEDIVYILGSRPSIVIGGPPCEAFTGANPERMKDPLDRLYKDPIGRLVIHFIRIVSELEPAIFVMENVPGIMKHPIREALEDLFRRAGYREIYFNVLRAEDHGTPSRRTRVFISNIEIKPPITRGPTAGEALSDLPPPGSGIPNHEYITLSPRKSKRIARIRKGGSLYFFEGAGGRRLSNYIRIDPMDIAPTVMGSSRFIHPYENRLLTVREQARLMGFPDNHIFIGGRDEQYNQVGEAVPPPLARAVAMEVKKAIDNQQWKA